MLPKSIVVSSFLLGSLAVAGLGAAMWLSPSHAQEPGSAVEARTRAPGAEAAQETLNNMKMILLAFHNYHDVNGHFPPLANYGADGLPKLSWRVALLPYLDQNDLYKAFRQDEPWDSPHNKALIDRMPAVFQTPDSPAPWSQTRIRGFAGKGAMFEGVRGIGIQEITDGTSNTVFIAVARDPVPWTQPAELPFAAGEPLPALDASDPQGYRLGLVDGSVRTLQKGEEQTLRLAITRAGGEVLVWPTPGAPATPGESVTSATPRPTPTPAATPAPTPAPTTPAAAFPPTGPAPTPAPAMMARMIPAAGPSSLQALEKRLQTVEEKLDRVLQKLDEVLSARQPLRR